MNIEILPTAQAALQYDFHGKTAVVIDVFRATSVITAALAAGAEGVAPVTTLDEARALASRLAATDVLLCGERNADPIPGFDIGNSPQLYTTDRVARKTIVLTTTNGTLALNAARHASSVYAASMLNYRAVARQLAQHHDLAIVCSGTDGQPALEDNVCAAAICQHIEALSPDKPLYLSDHAISIRLLASANGFPQRILPLSHHYRALVAKGYQEDVLFCANHHADIQILPRLDPDGLLRPAATEKAT